MQKFETRISVTYRHFSKIIGFEKVFYLPFPPFLGLRLYYGDPEDDYNIKLQEYTGHNCEISYNDSTGKFDVQISHAVINRSKVSDEDADEYISDIFNEYAGWEILHLDGDVEEFKKALTQYP